MINRRPERQQIFLSGIGGQGIVFITRLLAETAVYCGHHVLTSETHGMAQRGGVVISHLKIGDFKSPLIRAGMADSLIVLHQANFDLHRRYLKNGGSVIINAPDLVCPDTFALKVFSIDASALSEKLGHPESVNLLLVGFAVSVLDVAGLPMFCGAEDIREVIRRKLSEGRRLESALESFDYGVMCGKGQLNE